MKLASIERIKDLSPIEGADKIEVATILGYKVVVKKGEFNEGDLCVFHSPDCIVDETNPAYNFLKDKRLRVCKFRKQVSQGLALPIETVMSGIGKEGERAVWSKDFFTEGLDVSEMVKIRKYEKPLAPQLVGVAKGSLPSFLKKTDELNLRSYPKALDEFKNKYCVITKKYDGFSATFFIKDGVFGVCSRNLQLEQNENQAFWKIARKYKIEEALKAFQVKFPDGGDIAIQGEYYGPGVNGGHVGNKEPEFRAFNLFSIKHFKYANHDLFIEFCVDNNIPFVEIVWMGAFDLTLEQLIEMANKTEYAAGLPCEGLVLRPVTERTSEVLDGGRLSVKILSETYGLKYGE